MAVESTDLLILDRKKRKHKATDMEINLTSMIDVLFMLMLFFLLGSRFGAHEGILLSHLPQSQAGGGPPPSLVIPPVVIKLSEPSPNRPAFRMALGDAPAGDGNFELLAPDPKQADQLQIDDTKLYEDLVRVRNQVKDHLGDVTVRIVPDGNVQWNFCLQVLNTVSRAKFPEIRWSVPTRPRPHS